MSHLASLQESLQMPLAVALAISSHMTAVFQLGVILVMKKVEYVVYRRYLRTIEPVVIRHSSMPLSKTHSHVAFAFSVRSEVVRHKTQHIHGLTLTDFRLKRDSINAWSGGERRVLFSGQGGGA